MPLSGRRVTDDCAGAPLPSRGRGSSARCDGASTAAALPPRARIVLFGSVRRVGLLSLRHRVQPKRRGPFEAGGDEAVQDQRWGRAGEVEELRVERWAKPWNPTVAAPRIR